MNDTTPITAALRAIAGDATRILQNKLRSLDITPAQLDFLTTVADNPSHCGTDVARDNHISAQTVNTIKQNLIIRGLITVTRMAGAGRRNTITITEAGHRVLTEARQVSAKVESEFASLLGDEAITRIWKAHAELAPAGHGAETNR